jgi:hypothetical protein
MWDIDAEGDETSSKEANLTQIEKAGRSSEPAVCSPVPRVRRRTLLGGILTILASAPVWMSGIGRSPDRDADQLWPSRLSTEKVGRLYLEQAPHERDAGFLTRAVFGDRMPSGSGEDVRRLVASRAREDFRRDDAVVIDGWIMARSEARFCALALLA